MIKQILLPLMSHPEPTPDWAISAADELTVRLDAELSSTTAVIHIPDVTNILARKLVGADAAIAAENRTSQANTRTLAQRFAMITGSGQAERQSEIECRNFFVDPNPIACHARLYDLSILPSYGHPDTRWIAEALIFSSGRPTLLLPQSKAPICQRIVVGWDGSRAAARALADALPLCRLAENVTIVAVAGDKELPKDLSVDAVKQHLHHHGISSACEEITADRLGAGAALLAHCRVNNATLLVMGGFGHARMREFLLGGATATVLENTELPVFLSH